MNKLFSTLLATGLISICATASAAPKEIMLINHSDKTITVNLPMSDTRYFVQPNTTEAIRDVIGGRFSKLELWEYGASQKFYGAIVCDQAIITVGGTRGSFTISRDETLCS